MYECDRGVRIFEKIAGVRIRALVYEKKNSARGHHLLVIVALRGGRVSGVGGEAY